MLRNCVFITIFIALAEQVGALEISMQKKRSNPDGYESDDFDEYYEAAIRALENKASGKPVLSGSTPAVVSGARHRVSSNQQRRAIVGEVTNEVRESNKTQGDGTSVARSDSGAESPSADREDEIRAQQEAIRALLAFADRSPLTKREYDSDSDSDENFIKSLEEFGSTADVKLVEQMEDRKRKTEWNSKNQIPLIRNGLQHIAIGVASPVVLPISFFVAGANVCPEQKYGLIGNLLGAGLGAGVGGVYGALSAVRCTLNGTAQIIGSGVYKSKHFLRRKRSSTSTRKA